MCYTELAYNLLGGVLDSLGGAVARVACRDPAVSLNSGTF